MKDATHRGNVLMEATTASSQNERAIMFDIMVRFTLPSKGLGLPGHGIQNDNAGVLWDGAFIQKSSFSGLRRR